MQKMKNEWVEDDAALADMARFLTIDFPDSAPAFWRQFQSHVRNTKVVGKVSTAQLGYIRLALRTFV